MTKIAGKDAAILAHLSKQPSEEDRLLLTSRLGPEAKKLAPSLIKCKKHPRYTPGWRKPICPVCIEMWENKNVLQTM